MWLKALTTLYIILLAAIVIGANLGALSVFSGWLHRIPFGDKTCHFLFVGMLSFLINVSLTQNMRASRKRTAVFGTMLVLVVLTSIEECSQSLLNTRQFSELDLLANVAGVIVFGALALLLPTGRPTQPGIQPRADAMA